MHELRRKLGRRGGQRSSIRVIELLDLEELLLCLLVECWPKAELMPYLERRVWR